MRTLLEILESGDLNSFIDLIESEALMLHAMMLTSTPSFILMKPGTLGTIEKIRRFREETGIFCCFTLDAGANVHLLYLEQDINKIQEFIDTELVVFCENGKYICDGIGNGPERISV